MRYGFALVGCGMISRFHARAIADIADARLVGCVSHSYQSAQRLANELGCKCYRSLDEMLDDTDVHVVTICSPSGSHLVPTLAAIEAGKHVVVEKPLEITLARCDTIIQAAELRGVIVSTVFQSRFHDSSRLLKQAVDQGRFGTLTMGDAYVKWHRTQAYYDSGAWRGTWEFDGGGALMNQAIHSVDLLLWLTGPVAEIRAFTSTMAHERIEVEDVAVAALRFQNGALGTIEATTATYPGLLKRIEIHGTGGSVTIEEEDVKLWQFEEEDSRDAEIREQLAAKTETGGGAGDPAAIGHHGHTAQFKDVLHAIRIGQQPLINGREGRRSVEVICAIYESARTGNVVSLNG